MAHEGKNLVDEVLRLANEPRELVDKGQNLTHEVSTLVHEVPDLVDDVPNLASGFYCLARRVAGRERKLTTARTKRKNTGASDANAGVKSLL